MADLPLHLAVELGTPIRFLAVEWREPWEFDFPSLLLSPVVRYSPNGKHLDTMIEDVAIDIADALERQQPIHRGPHPGDQQEFDWRGWKLERIRRQAERHLKGKNVRLGIGRVETREQWVVFRPGIKFAVEFDLLPTVIPPA